jgi:CRP-like cAMP-binding protein
MLNNTVLKGSLHFINLPDILQILGGNNSTGTLRLTSPYAPDAGFIYFLNGNPINSTCGLLEGIESIYALFGWTEGKFEFHEGDVQMEHLVKQSRMEIVLDALRMLDDGVTKRVGPPSFDETDIEKRAGFGEKNCLPVIKGASIDYSDVGEEDFFYDGSVIGKRGGFGNWIWVIYEGIVTVRRETIHGHIDIARLGPGCFIGTFRALLFGSYVRSVTVLAEGDVRLATLMKERVGYEFSSLSPIFRSFLLSLNDRLRRITDRAVELYNQEDHYNGFPKDKKIFSEMGASQKDLFAITQGEVDIIGQTQKGDLPLLTLKKDDVFGNNPFVDFGHEPRSASVIASNDLEVVKFDTQKFQEEYDSLSNTLRNMIYHLCSCITMTTSLVYHFHTRK